jgi:hypothetical protein
MPYLTCQATRTDANFTRLDSHATPFNGKGKQRMTFASKVVCSAAALTKSMSGTAGVEEFSDTLSRRATTRGKGLDQSGASPSHWSQNPPLAGRSISFGSSSGLSTGIRMASADPRVDKEMELFAESSQNLTLPAIEKVELKASPRHISDESNAQPLSARENGQAVTWECLKSASAKSRGEEFGWTETQSSFQSCHDPVEDNEQQMFHSTAGLEPSHIDCQALNRLKLVVGHMSECPESYFAVQLDPTIAECFQQTMPIPEGPRHLPGLRETQNRHSPDEHHRHPRFTSKHGHNVSEKSLDSESTTPEFHCPWVQCHKVSLQGCLQRSLKPIPL